MNIMGMGIPELGVVMLVAFLVLGPSRAIEMARSAGKIIGDLRRSFGDVTSAMSVETMDQRTPTQDRIPGDQNEPPPGVPMRAETPPEDSDDQEPPEAGPEDKG
jgi:Sec-independent protein translocase protein TatA